MTPRGSASARLERDREDGQDQIRHVDSRPTRGRTTPASPESVREHIAKIKDSILKCEEHGIDVWVVDHLLSAPGLYGNAWLEPLSALAYAAALTTPRQAGHGILVLPVRHPVMLAKEISTLCHLSQGRYLFGVGPGWYAREYEVTGSRIEERGKADRRAHRGRAAAPVQAQRELPRPLLPLRRRDHRSEAAEAAGRVGVGRLAGPGSRRARRAEARHHRGGADRSRRPLDLAMLGEAGVGEAGLGGPPAARGANGARSEEPDVRPLQLHAPRGDDEARAGRRGVQGAVPARRWGRTAAGSTSRSPTWWAPSTGSTRASPISCPPGLQYMVLGPVTDDPKQFDLIAKHVMPAFA